MKRIAFVDYIRVITIPCIAILSYICCIIATKIISMIPGSKWIVG